MATLISNMVGDTTNGAAAKANRKAKGSARALTAGSRNRERVFAGNFANNSTSPRRSQILGNLIASANARTARSEARNGS